MDLYYPENVTQHGNCEERTNVVNVSKYIVILTTESISSDQMASGREVILGSRKN